MWNEESSSVLPFPPDYSPFISLQTLLAVLIPLLALFAALVLAITAMHYCRRICSRGEFDEDYEDEKTASCQQVIVARPRSPDIDSFRRNSAQAQYRLLIQSKFEREFGKSRPPSKLVHHDSRVTIRSV